MFVFDDKEEVMPDFELEQDRYSPFGNTELGHVLYFEGHIVGFLKIDAIGAAAITKTLNFALRISDLNRQFGAKEMCANGDMLWRSVHEL